MPIIRCKMCGGAIEINQGKTVCTCEYCGTQQTLPKLDDERRVNLYDRANHFRRNNEFDKAMGIYESILNEDSSDAEAYWSIVLCRYGIEYVEDPTTHKRLPTVNRAQYTSIYADEDYKSAIANADTLQKTVYEAEAKAIDDIQKRILEISAKEEPFDVFISFKETDANGRRTPDTVLANDLYHQLTQEGYKVFYAPITLEDKLGQEYEPYIFAALNSAKVMVVLGTKPEYFNAVWVKNEWSRFLALIKGGTKKTLIPAYKDMDPYDLPEEFSHLMAQDMSKLGFMQDLLRGIKKITAADEPKQTVKETVIVNNVALGSAAGNAAPLLKRAFMFLEDGDWNSANEYCEKVLDQDPENGQAYLGKMMAELKVNKVEDLKNCAQPFDGNKNYQKACRFESSLKENLEVVLSFIRDRNETARINEIYNDAIRIMNNAKTEKAYREAVCKFESIKTFKKSSEYLTVCQEKALKCSKDEAYANAKAIMSGDTISDYRTAKSLFERIGNWKDATDQIKKCEQKISEIRARDEAARKKAEEARLEAERKAEEERIAAEKAAKRARRFATVICVIAVLLAAGYFGYKKYVVTEQDYMSATSGEEYNDGEAQIEAGKTEEQQFEEKLNAPLKENNTVMSYAEYAAAELDSKVCVETYVQAHQSWWEDKVTVYSQDQDGAYFLYNMACSEEDAAKLVPGTKIKVTGYKAEWCGEVEITDASFEFVEGDSFVAEAEDVTDLLGNDDLVNSQNKFVTFKGMTVEKANDDGAAFLYNWDGSGEDGNDLYFNVSKDGKTYSFTVESYLCGAGTEVYEAVKALKVGDVIDLEGFLYWFEGVNPHITSVKAAA